MLVKCVAVVSSDAKQEIVLRFGEAPSNRVTRAEPLDKFLLLSFTDFRLRWPPISPGEPSRAATGKENGNYITRLLTTGIVLNGVRYHFFGHSNSQLKSRSCFMYAASKETISSKIEAMGDLSKLKSVGKKAKRIGLLFSSAEMALQLPSNRCQDIDDVKRDEYIFTDGCGLISPHLARQLVQQRNVMFRDKRYLPSVYQIRYRGYKGVLTLDPTLKGQIQVQFRESMRKFKDAADHSFAVVDYSKPYAFGSLNDEVVVLLHTLGISQNTLLRKQHEHLKFLQNVSRGDSRAAFQFLSYSSRLDLAERLLLDGIESVQPTLASLVKQEYTKMLNKRDEQRCRILIPKSRLLFGICDPSSKDGRLGTLKEGECFVRVTRDGSGIPETIINTEVLVTRNPCLHPGDLQKFKAVDVPVFANSLTDCIVFSTRGRRPSADLMSGGDLDGDKFFVTWDPDIIPRTMAEPAQYPGGKELVTFGEVTGDARAEYFARYTNASLGKVKNLYMKWARLGNAMSPECQQLNRLFSQCVDGNHIRIPENLQELKGLDDPPEPSETVAPFILDILHSASTDFIQRQASVAPELTDGADVMELFMSRDKLAISEFELLRLVSRWCERNCVDIMEFCSQFNFSALSDEQQIWFLSRLPPSATTPSLVRNGLLQSDSISPAELQPFSLDHPQMHWKPLFKSSSDRMGRFLPTVSRALEIFHKKLVVITVDERLSLAIYIPNKIPRSSEVQVDTNIRVLTLPHSQGPNSPNYRAIPTKVNYRLYCDDHVFELYERKRSATWIFLRRSHGDDTLYRNEKNKGDKRRKREQTIQTETNFDCVASVALDKTSREIQQHIGRVNRKGILGAEIYVISNRDVQSMNFMDQWLEYIDTEETLPLFERVDTEYKLPKLMDVDWNMHTNLVTAVARDRNFSHLRRLSSITDLQTILELLNSHNEKKILRDVYSHVLDLEAGSSSYLDGEVIASTFLSFVAEAVYLIPTFFSSQTWRNRKSALEDTLIHLAPTLLQRLVLSANELGSFIRHPFSLLLQELRRISLQDFAELVELIALSVRSAEAALDLLLEILEPEVDRLLVGRPAAMHQFCSSLMGNALDHIDEASDSRKSEAEPLKIFFDHEKEGFVIVKSTLRVDSSMNGKLKIGDHVRLTVPNSPQNDPIARPCSMDAIVLTAENGLVTFRCLHRPPSYLEQCAWTIIHCGSFVTSQTTFDALTTFYTQREACCKIYSLLIGISEANQILLPGVDLPVIEEPLLNQSQNAALRAAMKHSLTFIWGPPGTGKTHAIVVILTQLLKALPKSRFLVSAPTHNAVDNLLRRFVNDEHAKRCGVIPLVKVASDLRSYTCDAMLGKDLTGNLPARRKAQKRIKDSRLIFTTCTGAALGLLRTESFDVVIVDEASQQTEPATLVPLVKGCSRAILVGDHVQLRATVQKHAVITGYDVSLFERHYNLPERPGIAKVMLGTQYRMHRSICNFSSTEFYEGKLKTAVADRTRPLPPSMFPWPENSRLAWVECSSSEDLGRQSKANAGQVALCKKVIQLLKDPPPAPPTTSASAPSPSPTIVILTPYTRQKEALAPAIPNVEVSSIDGFQGREADIVVFVTVRCNTACAMGFLTDMRRLNVVMTRAKTGVVVIGNKQTLTGTAMGEEAVDETIKFQASYQPLFEASQSFSDENSYPTTILKLKDRTMPGFLSFVYGQWFTQLPKPTTSFAGKTVIVTGSNIGLGKEAARHITRNNASTVILAVRSLDKGEAAKKEIEQSTGKKDVIKVWQLDMSSYQSVLDFAARANKELQRLDVAILNASVARGEWEVFEKDESTITVNVVSTFLLGLSFLPKMKETAAKFNTRPTLTVVASEVHAWAKFPEADAPAGQIFASLNKKFDKINGDNMGNRYQVSKLLDVFGVRAMADRKSAQAIPVTFNCVNPGFCHSELAREGGLTFVIMKFFLARTTEVGSRTLVHAASGGAELHGQYLTDCKVAPASDYVLSAEGYDAQNRVWEELAEKLEAIKPGVTGNL
ncbi:hypothetical protein N0V90_012070 [Kalmusia sp. IMI 367209]|nr:hypothetical protein N0V90_012070 [Kalmusia sp. IMI 367209]